ncbi:MAG: D-glycerate dehydrogenase [Nitrospira sp.]|nr:D-glycerate dehydrogenase [Nitrospira sp.]
MITPAIYVTRVLPEPLMAALRERYRLVSEPREDHIPTAEDLRTGFAQTDAVICMLSDSIDADLLSHATKLKILANYAVGYNNIDLAAAKARGIIVTNTPDALTDATADLAWALMLSVARRVVEGDHWVRTGTWRGWAPTQLLGTDLAGKTLGIIGMGRIGQAVAQRAQGFRMRVLYESRRSVTSPPGLLWEHRPLDQLLAEADFVSLHVPLTESTRHLIGARELSRMKPTAILINTARGPVVDEEALVAALKTGVIAGAGLDVYEQEPLVHPGLVELPNVVLLPHVGSGTLETRIRMGRICLDNIEAVLSGRPAPNQVS